MNPPHLVLLPGLINDARLWQGQSPTLSNFAGVTVGDITGAPSISALAASVLVKAPVEQFALAGLSMGGYVALEIMRQAPERITHLALLDTSARPDTPEATEGRRAMMKLSETDFPAVVDALAKKLLHPEHLKDEAMLGLVKAMGLSVGAEAYRRQQEAIIGRIDSRPWLHRIQCPTLVLCGREDAVTPVSLHEEMAAEIPGAQLTILGDCGHLSALEQPEQVAEALRAWLVNPVNT